MWCIGMYIYIGVMIVFEEYRAGGSVEGVGGKYLKAVLRGFTFANHKYPLYKKYPKRFLPRFYLGL